MTERELLERTKQFALRIFKLVGALPQTIQGRAVASQLIRSGTSVAANYRAACRARSKPEFVAKLGVVEEEADFGDSTTCASKTLPLIQASQRNSTIRGRLVCLAS